MNKAKIITFVGMPGAGKGTCSEYLAIKFGFPLVHFGNMFYEEVQRRGLDNIKDEKFVREDMRVQEGSAVLAKHAATKAEAFFADGAEAVVFDGLYSWTEFKYLHGRYGKDMIMIALVAPRQERYNRVLRRTDGHRKYANADQIEARDIAEIETIEKGGPIAFADYTINNNGNPQELKLNLDNLLQQLGF